MDEPQRGWIAPTLSRLGAIALPGLAGLRMVSAYLTANPWFGESSTVADKRALTVAILLFVWSLVLSPVLFALAAWLDRRPIGRWLAVSFVALVLASCVSAVALAPPNEPYQPSGGCQEHSGGDSTCPGG